jgi:arginine/lysine/ornithine decarboxylase
MTTPIYDFVKNYADKNVSRFHMPAHKGAGLLGCEELDITEINGADVLYGADGIIAESENNATRLFGSAHTFYSTEGSSLCIKAMLALAIENTPMGSRPLILAARNVHKAFVYACALLDVDVEWIYPNEDEHICVCKIGAKDVISAFNRAKRRPSAVYITSPDYLGNIVDIGSVATACDELGVPLLVDNAHGAYLKFLSPSLHPLDLGASMCCDSAHKTLPVLTGGAYLHVAKKAEKYMANARSSLALFASTSPSYLTLVSLDLCNRYINDGYAQKLKSLCAKLEKIKSELRDNSVAISGDEPLKLTLDAESIGYTGEQIAEQLRKNNIECEFADSQYIVLMISTENTDNDLSRLVKVIKALDKKAPVTRQHITAVKSTCSALTIREAVLSSKESVPIDKAIGRVCASPTVSCPPAVPVVISGERISESAVRALEYYGIKTVEVVKL